MGYDITWAFHEQLSTNKQEQKNCCQTNQLTFRDAHLTLYAQ